MYHKIAHLYDWPGALDFASKITQKDLALLEKNGLRKGSKVLDLACGTGTLGITLAQAGYQVMGIDLSISMLEQAKRKAAEHDQSLSIEWQEGDMRYFSLNERVDAVLCHYDSLNHLSNETELRGTFLQVAEALKPGGIFIFDLNTLENYQTFWNGKDTYEGPNYRLKTTASFNEDSGKAEVLFAVDEYNENGELFHHEETVYEQYFNERAVEKYLMTADFYDVENEAFNPVEDLPADFPLKTFWTCRRR